MALIIENTTGSDIVLDELGITVSASSTYDLSWRPPEAVASSYELAGYITSGNISVVSDTLNVLSNAVGYTQVISGDPTYRPVSPPPGTMRHNSNTNVVEIYQSGAWQSMPNMQSTLFIIDSATGNLCYYDTTREKYLTVLALNFSYSNPNSADLAWLYIDSNINHAQSGYVSPLYGTITNLGVYTDMTGIDKSVSVYVNNTEYSNTVTFSGSMNANSVATNIDFNPGDTVRFRVRSDTAGTVGAIYVTAFIALRGFV